MSRAHTPVHETTEAVAYDCSGNDHILSEYTGLVNRRSHNRSAKDHVQTLRLRSAAFLSHPDNISNSPSAHIAATIGAFRTLVLVREQGAL